jgi:hypothetical protein
VEKRILYSPNEGDITKTRKTLVRYIDNQHEHHHIKTFEEELIELFLAYNVEYDEKHLWD